MFYVYLILSALHLATASIVTISHENELEQSAQNKSQTTMTPHEGEICALEELKHPHEAPNQYYECTLPSTNATTWPWDNLGLWIVERCPAGKVFSPAGLHCRSESSVRRLQARDCNLWPESCGMPSQPGPMPIMPCEGAGCPMGPPMMQEVVTITQTGGPCPTPPCVNNIPMPCPVANAINGVGNVCSWMLAPLVPGPVPTSYLQCVPVSGYCGRWIPRPCAPATEFDVRIQVCVHAQNGICAGNTVFLGPCNNMQQCPGNSAVCDNGNNACCSPVLQ